MKTQTRQGGIWRNLQCSFSARSPWLNRQKGEREKKDSSQINHWSISPYLNYASGRDAGRIKRHNLDKNISLLSKVKTCLRLSQTSLRTVGEKSKAVPEANASTAACLSASPSPYMLACLKVKHLQLEQAKFFERWNRKGKNHNRLKRLRVHNTFTQSLPNIDENPWSPTQSPETNYLSRKSTRGKMQD